MNILQYCISLLFFCLFNYQIANTQSSFIKAFDIQATDDFTLNGSVFFINLLEDKQTNELNSVFALLNQGLAYIKLSPSGNFINGYKVKPPSENGLWTPGSNRSAFAYNNNQSASLLLNLGGNQTALFFYNESNQQTWGCSLSPSVIRQEKACISMDQKVLSSHDTEGTLETKKHLGLCLLDGLSGNPLWTHYYKTTPIDSLQEILPISIKELPSGNFIILSEVWNNEFISGNHLLEIDHTGLIIRSKYVAQEWGTIKNLSLDSQGNIIILASVNNINDNTKQDGVIIKLNPDFNLIWSKRLLVSEYTYSGLNVSIDKHNNINFIYTSIGHFPAIAGQISSSGQLIRYDGYAIYSNITNITSNNEILMASYYKYHPDASVEVAFIAMKTNPDGTFDNCEIFPACLMLEDINIKLINSNWHFSEAQAPASIPSIVEPMNAVLNDYCPEPPFPLPYFSIAEQMCVGGTLEVDSLLNQLSNNAVWHIEGPNIDTLIDNNNLSITLNTVGTYNISQKIWVLGCEQSYSQSIEVISPSTQKLLEEDHLVCDSSYLLKVKSNFSAQASYLWSTGDTSSQISVTQTGLYSVSINDYGCMYSDSVQLDFLHQLSPSASTELIKDTLLCEQALPLVLYPSNAYTNNFWLDNQPNQSSSSLVLPQAGIYTIAAQVRNCIVKSQCKIQTQSCEAQIYFPNSFSPNADGKNDDIGPMGNKFEGIRLCIYDRWGNQLWEKKNAPFLWSGRSAKGEYLETGVYIAVFEYFNILRGQTESISQDIMLLRY